MLCGLPVTSSGKFTTNTSGIFGCFVGIRTVLSLALVAVIFYLLHADVTELFDSVLAYCVIATVFGGAKFVGTVWNIKLTLIAFNVSLGYTDSTITRTILSTAAFFLTVLSAWQQH